jgi:hypothetical protein
MTGSAAVAYLYPRSTTFNAFSLDMRLGSYRPMMDRREIADLIRQDAARDQRDPIWMAYVVENIVEFMIHARRPTGVITEDDGEWLVGLFGDAPSPTVPEVLRGLVAEAESLPPILVGYALSCGAMRL